MISHGKFSEADDLFPRNEILTVYIFIYFSFIENCLFIVFLNEIIICVVFDSLLQVGELGIGQLLVLSGILNYPLATSDF